MGQLLFGKLPLGILLSFFSIIHPVTVTTLTVMVWVWVALKTSTLTAHLSFIRARPKPARKYQGMRFPWPSGMHAISLHKSHRQTCSVSNPIFIPLQIWAHLTTPLFYCRTGQDIDLVASLNLSAFGAGGSTHKNRSVI